MPQVVVMPSLLLAGWVHPPWSLTAQSVFVNVFPSLLLIDFATMKLNIMVAAHHAVCLCGHTFAVLTAPESFWFYFAGVVALEAGSGTACAWWLFGETRPKLSMTYALGMTASNVLAAAAQLIWSLSATSLSLPLRVVPTLVTAVLIYFRQIEMQNLMRGGRAASGTG